MFTWTILLALVFSAGLITGQRLLRSASTPPLISVRASTDADATDGVSEKHKPLKTTFSFYEKLSNPESEKEIVPSEAPEKPTAAEKVEKAEEKVEQKPVEKVVAEKSEKKEEAKPVVAEKVAIAEKPKEAPQAKPVAETLANAKDAIAKVKEIVKPKANDKALAARYTLQISAHPDRAASEKQVAKLRSMGYETHVVVVDIANKGKLYRVRVGKFHAMDEARKFQKSIKTERGVTSFVTPL